MATRRMIAKQVIGSDKYIELSYEAQALYIQMTIEADDFGFITGINRLRRSIGVDDSTITELSAEQFIIQFESGAVVIRHWFVANFGGELNKKSKALNTCYLNELARLDIDTDGAYILSDKSMTAIRGEQIESGHLNPIQCKIVQYIMRAEQTNEKPDDEKDNPSGNNSATDARNTNASGGNPAQVDNKSTETQSPSATSAEDEFDELLSRFDGFTKDELNVYRKHNGDDKCKVAMQRTLAIIRDRKPTMIDFLTKIQ